MKKYLNGVMFLGAGLLVVLVLLAVLLPMRSHKNDTVYSDPYDDNVYYTAEYLAREGGYIMGEPTQTIKEGESLSAVTAVAYEGYEFIGWSDANATEEKRADILNPTRHDKNITRDFNQVAYFRTSQKTFTYNYNGATSDTSVKSVTFKYDESQFTLPHLIIPQKDGYEFAGWYLEEDFITKAIDSNGTYMLGYAIFDTTLTSENLYAKWTVPSDEIVYKILMVFVDEVRATLKAIDGAHVDIDYKMTAFEREICRKISNEFTRTLNEWFEGLVRFEVDMYFTTQTITSFRSSNRIFADEIPEVSEMLKDYRSTLVSLSLNDYDNRLRYFSGIATRKHGLVCLESVFNRFYWWNLKEDFERLLICDITEFRTYLHEFTHTVEWYYVGGELYSYHNALDYCIDHSESSLDCTRLYLRGNYKTVDEENIGIPFSYWQGDVIMYVDYYSQGNYFPSPGNEPIMLIDGVEHVRSVEQKVLFGRDAKEVTIIPPKGFRFTHWSDGQTNPTRKDENILEFMMFTACFEMLDDVRLHYGDSMLDKGVDEVNMDTNLKVWSFATSELELANPTAIDCNDVGEYDVIHLSFSDGTEFSLVTGEYAFYDKSLNEFVVVDQDIVQYLGHSFNKLFHNPASGIFSLEEIELVNVVVEKNVYLRPNNVPKLNQNQAYFVNSIMATPSENAANFNYGNRSLSALEFEQ